MSYMLKVDKLPKLGAYVKEDLPAMDKGVQTEEMATEQNQNNRLTSMASACPLSGDIYGNSFIFKHLMNCHTKYHGVAKKKPVLIPKLKRSADCSRGLPSVVLPHPNKGIELYIAENNNYYLVENIGQHLMPITNHEKGQKRKKHTCATCTCVKPPKTKKEDHTYSTVTELQKTLTDIPKKDHDHIYCKMWWCQCFMSQQQQRS